jgi:hypothetical protein
VSCGAPAGMSHRELEVSPPRHEHVDDAKPSTSGPTVSYMDYSVKDDFTPTKKGKGDVWVEVGTNSGKGKGDNDPKKRSKRARLIILGAHSVVMLHLCVSKVSWRRFDCVHALALTCLDPSAAC